MLRRLVNDALRGDAGAVKLLMSLVERYGDSPEAAIINMPPRSLKSITASVAFPAMSSGMTRRAASFASPIPATCPGSTATTSAL
jgi:hypothetical protein